MLLRPAPSLGLCPLQSTTRWVSRASLGPPGRGESDANETSGIATARPTMGPDQRQDLLWHCFSVQQPWLGCDPCRVACRYRDLRYEMENMDPKGKRRVLHEDELVRGGLSVDPTPSDRQAVIAMRDRLADLEGQLALAQAMKGKGGLLPDDDMLGERRSALAAENRQVPSAPPHRVIRAFPARSSTAP